MATPARGVLGHAADPSRLKRKSSPPPYACLRRPSGTPGGPPAAHKASRRLGGPRAAGSGATHLSGRSAPSLPGSPSPGCPDTSQSRIPFPPYWENFLLPLDGSNRAKKPSPSSPLQSLPESHPSDRCVQGTLDEPPGVPRGLQPPPTRQLLEGFRFPEAEPLPTASSWRPVPLLVLLLCSGSGGFLEEGRPDQGPVGRTLQRGPGPSWPWLSAVTTVSSLWGPASAWSTLCWARPSGSLTDRVSTRLSPEVWSPRGCPGLRQHCCTRIPRENSRA